MIRTHQLLCLILLLSWIRLFSQHLRRNKVFLCTFLAFSLSVYLINGLHTDACKLYRRLLFIEEVSSLEIIDFLQQEGDTMAKSKQNSDIQIFSDGQ